MSTTEAVLARRLSRMRWLATGLLVAMAVVFVGASLLLDAYPWLGAVRAFAEAGMIGALADWFAIAALFRRPLGLPIPHTAIVPSRKNEIGRALARFVRDHFLVRDAVAGRLASADIAARLGAALEREGNASLISRDLSVALDWLMDASDSSQLRAAVKGGLSEVLERVPVNLTLAVIVDVLVSGDNAQALVDQLVQFGREQLEHNKERIRQRVRDRSPWWLPRFVDEQIYEQLVTELERILQEISDNPDHEARSQFNRRLQMLRDSLTENTALIERGEALKNEFLRHPGVKTYFEDVWERIRVYVQRSLRNPDSNIRLSAEREFINIGQRLRADVLAREHLNRWLGDLILYFVENYRQPVSEIISETIEKWDATATAQRIELHIGRDLQFIRINGTLVGGLVGLALYGLWGFFEL